MTPDNRIHSLKTLKENRSKLRKNLTPAEAALWRYLQSSQLNGRKFIRQHSIEHYIVDFYCAREKLVVELDGEVHNNPIASANDRERDDRLQQLGFRVLRFENKLVFNNIGGVLECISSYFHHP